MGDRIEWVVCGRVIGTATGWDGEGFSMQLYDFEPLEGCSIPKCEVLFIMFEDGVAEAHDGDGIITFTGDLIDSIANANEKRIH